MDRELSSCRDGEGWRNRGRRQPCAPVSVALPATLSTPLPACASVPHGPAISGSWAGLCATRGATHDSAATRCTPPRTDRTTVASASAKRTPCRGSSCTEVARATTVGRIIILVRAAPGG